MGWFYLPKIEPTTRQKGFMCGNVFVPIEIQTPSVGKKGICIELPKNLPSEGLIFHFTGESSTAETGQSPKEEGSSIKYAQTIDGIPCVTFPTNSDFLKYDDIGLIGSFDATVSAWVYFPQTPSNSWVNIVGWGRRTASNPPTTKPAGNEIGFISGVPSGGSCPIYGKTGCYSSGESTSEMLVQALSVNKWYHLLMTFDKTEKKVRYFVDGDLAASKTIDELDIESSELVLNFNIGYYNNSENNVCSLAGVRVYNRVLSDSELDALNNEFFGGEVFIPLEVVQPIAGSDFEKTSEEMPEEGLILHVPLSQSDTADELGNELSETGNVAFTTIEGIQCAQFDGDSYIQFIVDSEKALSGSSTNVPFTVTLWAYSQPSQYNSDTRGVFQYSTSVPENSNKTGISIDTSTEGKIFDVDITDGFHFVAVTRDSTGEIKCYLDGVLVDASIDSLRTPDSSGYIGRIVFQTIMA